MAGFSRGPVVAIAKPMPTGILPRRARLGILGNSGLVGTRETLYTFATTQTDGSPAETGPADFPPDLGPGAGDPGSSRCPIEAWSASLTGTGTGGEQAAA